MFLSDLDVVNNCLGTMGELPVNDLDDDHNLVAQARRDLTLCNTREQLKRWWFNTEFVSLVRDIDGYMWVPTNAATCTPIRDGLNLVQRGRRMYSNGSIHCEAGFKMVWERLDVMVRTVVPFEELPPSVQILVNAATKLSFMAAYDADGQKYRQILGEYQEAYMTVNAEHIEAVKRNMLWNRHALNDIAPRSFNRLPTPGYLPGV